jgi:hypothetical protein
MLSYVDFTYYNFAQSLVGLRLCFLDNDGAGFHDPAHIVDRYVDVCQRVAFDGDEVGKITWRNRPEFFFFAQ